jgi:hypothetical protein
MSFFLQLRKCSSSSEFSYISLYKKFNGRKTLLANVGLYARVSSAWGGARVVHLDVNLFSKWGDQKINCSKKVEALIGSFYKISFTVENDYSITKKNEFTDFSKPGF